MKDWRVAVAAAVATIAVIGAAQAITETAFNYSSPKVGFFSINPVALTSDTSLMDWEKDSTRLSREGGQAKCFGAGVNLPQGATLTNVMVWYHSDEIAQNPQFSLQRQRHSDGVLQNIAQLVGTDHSSLRASVSVAVDPSNLTTIDNARFSYAFRVCPISIQTSFFSARIRYTYSNAGD